jgi:hypothetical protein
MTDRETVDVTNSGQSTHPDRPAGKSEKSQPSKILAQLAALGRAAWAERPGYRPPMRPGDGTDRLSDALAVLRDGER